MKYFKTIRFYSELFPLYLSTLSIRSKRIYVFGAWQGQKFSDNSKYLYLQAIKDSSIKAIWITKNRKIYEYMRGKGYPVFMHNSLKGIYYQLRASFYFTSERTQDVSALLIGNATRINLWHGVGLKKILHDDKINHEKRLYAKGILKRSLKRIRSYPYRKHYVLSTSETMTKIFSSAFKKTPEKILELGQPRNDVFFDDTLEIERLPFAEMGKRVILYMPTHRNFGATPIQMSKIFDLAKLDEFCKVNSLLFVVKKHFCHRFEIEHLSGYANILDITQTEYDTQLLLKKASILITDYSSCYVDYLLLDRPVIFYNYDYDNYLLNDRDLYFDYEQTTPGPKVKDFPCLLHCLEKAIHSDNDEFKNERKRINNIFYSEANQQKVGPKILEYVKRNIR
jgi:CDP-glycerol glycerophosphotransferase